MESPVRQGPDADRETQYYCTSKESLIGAPGGENVGCLRRSVEPALIVGTGGPIILPATRWLLLVRSLVPSGCVSAWGGGFSSYARQGCRSPEKRARSEVGHQGRCAAAVARRRRCCAPRRAASFRRVVYVACASRGAVPGRRDRVARRELRRSDHDHRPIGPPLDAGLLRGLGPSRRLPDPTGSRFRPRQRSGPLDRPGELRRDGAEQGDRLSRGRRDRGSRGPRQAGQVDRRDVARPVLHGRRDPGARAATARSPADEAGHLSAGARSPDAPGQSGDPANAVYAA